jgi:hypothetical protein
MNMNNYQLYHTNILLGGQMKWDLILDLSNNDLVVSDFHLTPISNNVPYNKYSKDQLLNYKHEENVSRFYKKISGHFYKEMIDSKLSSEWPIIKDSDKFQDTHDSQYEMGCNRALYKVYGKQFEFLCPVWLEHLDGDLSFEISILSKFGGTPLITKVLKLSKGNYSTPEGIYHDKFTNYFNSYISNIGLDKGNDRVMSVHLDKGTSQISALNVKTGMNEVKDLPNLVTNLISRERPLMEFDNMIIQSFPDNALIAHQLFNFNLCFNISDILNPMLSSMLSKQCVYIKVDVRVGDKLLEMRDFYSNYSYIPKKRCGYDFVINDSGITHLQGEETSPNVLDYMKDNKFIDFINRNKIVQSTVHWSLVGNNDYILNCYNGFGGYYEENGKLHNIPHVYGDSPDLTKLIYTPSLNNSSWCNTASFESKNYQDWALDELVNKLPALHQHMVNFGGNNWVKNIKYKSPNSNNMYVLNVHCPVGRDLLTKRGDDFVNGILLKLKNSISNDQDSTYSDLVGVKSHHHENTNITIFEICAYISADFKESPTNVPSNMLYDWVKDNMQMCTIVFFINGSYKDDSTFKGIKQALEEYTKNASSSITQCVFQLLQENLNAADMNGLAVVSNSTSIDIERADSPSLSSKEIEYYKNDKSSGEYVYRYSGPIRPSFISLSNDTNFNYVYYRDSVVWDGSKYKKYYGSGYPPLYPSIDYCSLLERRFSYECPNEESLKGFVNVGSEYKWFNHNLRHNLIPEISTILESRKDVNGEFVKIIDLVKEFVGEYYGVKDEKLDYIYNLYDVKYSFEYKSPSNINEYVYDIKLTLK